MSISIQLKGVSKKFGEVTAVNGVSFTANEGELMALLGPSGGGKTTVLRMIAGLEIPTSGDIFIGGKRVNDISVQRRNIGFVFQNYALFKNMNVFKNIAFGLKIKKWKRRDGGGKTTVLRMIAGLEMPTEGDIFIRGQRVNDISVQRRNIGFVFQNYALFKNMNVFKNIAFGLKVKKWKRADIKARIAELLELFGLA